MNLFAVGDFHKDTDLRDAAIQHIQEQDYDLVIFTGDYETEDYYESLIQDLDTPFISLTGNWDFGFEPPENGEYTNLFNYKEVEFGEYRIVLMGAMYPDDFMDRIADFFAEADNEHCIVATHYPPHMLGDLTTMGTRAGFPEFRELIIREKPALWLCGHIHEDYGAFELLQTTVLNCAAEESGKGWRISLTEDGVEEQEEVVIVDE